MRAIVSKNIPYGLRSQIPSGMGHQVSQADTHWTRGNSCARFDTRNLRSPQHPDSAGPRLQRPRAHIYLNAAADFRIKDRTISERQNLPQTSARGRQSAKKVLGSASVGTRVFCRLIRHDHRRNDYAVYRESGRGRGEARRQFYHTLNIGESALARPCEKTYRLEAVG